MCGRGYSQNSRPANFFAEQRAPLQVLQIRRPPRETGENLSFQIVLKAEFAKTAVRAGNRRPALVTRGRHVRERTKVSSNPSRTLIAALG